MKRFRVHAVVAVAAVLSACSRAPKSDPIADEKAIRAVSAHWLELENAHDAAGAAALFADDGVRYRAHRDPAAGLVAIEAAAMKDYTDNPKLVAEWTTDTVMVAASGDLAIELGTYARTHTGLKGDGDDRGHFVTVYRKVSDRWVVSRDMGATQMPELKPVAPPRVSVVSAVRPRVAATRPRSVAKASAKRPVKSTPARTVASKAKTSAKKHAAPR